MVVRGGGARHSRENHEHAGTQYVDVHSVIHTEPIPRVLVSPERAEEQTQPLGGPLAITVRTPALAHAVRLLTATTQDIWRAVSDPDMTDQLLPIDHDIDEDDVALTTETLPTVGDLPTIGELPIPAEIDTEADAGVDTISPWFDESDDVEFSPSSGDLFAADRKEATHVAFNRSSAHRPIDAHDPQDMRRVLDALRRWDPNQGRNP